MKRHARADDSARPAIILVTSRSGYPNGAGAAARLRTWARGFVGAGFECHVVLLKPSEPSTGEVLNAESRGTVDGVHFWYACGCVRAAATVPGRIALAVRGIAGFLSVVRTVSRRTRIAAFHHYMPEGFTAVVATFVAAKATGARLYGERTEASTTMRRVLAPVFEATAHRLFDGYVVISDYLRAYMAPRLRKRAKLITVPIQVDVDAFDAPQSNGANGVRSVIYCGATSGNDDVPASIRVFAQAAEGVDGWRLAIVGRITEERRRELAALAEALRAGGRVVFVGHVAACDIPRTLAEAAIAILPRAEGVFSTAGFPTKLGEYLASGIPVIVTATGDIPKYLKDGVEAIVVAPGSLEEFARRLREVMTGYEQYRDLGMRGRAAAAAMFDYRSGTRRVVEAMELGR